MEITLGILALLVAILAGLQGWQMLNGKKNRHNPSLDSHLIDKSDKILQTLNRMEQRLGDIWDRVNK